MKYHYSFSTATKISLFFIYMFESTFVYTFAVVLSKMFYLDMLKLICCFGGTVDRSTITLSGSTPDFSSFPNILRKFLPKPDLYYHEIYL